MLNFRRSTSTLKYFILNWFNFFEKTGTFVFYYSFKDFVPSTTIPNVLLWLNASRKDSESIGERCWCPGQYHAACPPKLSQQLDGSGLISHPHHLYNFNLPHSHLNHSGFVLHGAKVSLEKCARHEMAFPHTQLHQTGFC